MNRIKLILLTIVLSFLAGCTTQQIDQLLKKIPDASSGVEVTSQEAQENFSGCCGSFSGCCGSFFEQFGNPSIEHEPTSSQRLVVSQIRPEKVWFPPLTRQSSL